jgi:hypothetical protein
MRDTSYAIAATARDGEIPDDRKDDIDELPPIQEYFQERYGALWSPGPSNGDGETEIKTESTSLDLF